MKVDPTLAEAIPLPWKVVSGGQTGADRAGLDWAIDHGIAHGGWCPRGRLAEDGRIPVGYDLQPTPGADYAERTAWNVRDADVTLVFSLNPVLRGGSLYTAEVAEGMRRPWLHLPHTLGQEEAVRRLRAFLKEHPARTLNVAGPRSSQEPGVGDWVKAVLTRTFAVGEAETSDRGMNRGG